MKRELVTRPAAPGQTNARAERGLAMLEVARFAARIPAAPVFPGTGTPSTDGLCLTRTLGLSCDTLRRTSSVASPVNRTPHGS